MPEKEGSDDGKRSTKSVVNKKEKQFMNQEGLDLTKIAEAFGGHVMEAKEKNGKKNGKKKGEIDDFIAADDPFDVKAQQDAKKDIEQTGGTDTRPSFSRQDSFQKSGKFKEPETNPLRKKGGRPKPGSVKFTQRPGERPVKITRDPSVIDPKFAKKKTLKQKVDVEAEQDYKKAAKSFKKDIGGEKIVSPTMQDRLKKITAGPRKARKRRSDAASFAQVKADIDTADAARKAKSKGEYAADYEKRLEIATGKSLEGTTQTGRVPAGRPLPAGTKKGEPQKPRPKDEPAVQTGTYSGRGVGRQEKIPTSKTQETGGRSSQTKDPDLLRSVQSGINPRTGQYYDDDEAGRELRKSDFQTTKGGAVDTDKSKGGAVDTDKSKGEKSFSTFRGDSKIERDKKLGDRDRFRQDAPGREGESITMKSRSSQFKTDITDPNKVGKKFQDIASDSQKGQQSMMGAMGGVVAKTAFPSSSGAEAGLRFARGDKMGATLSALQSMGGGLGFGAGVLNALRSMSPNYTPPAATQKAPDTPTVTGSGKDTAIVRNPKKPMPAGGKEAMMAGGGMMLSKVLQNIRRNAKNVGSGLGVRGGRAINVSAKS